MCGRGVRVYVCVFTSLVSRLEAAMATFIKARPPGIYKQEYLDELSRRYGGGESMPAPPRPAWCQEESEGDIAGAMESGGSKKRRREQQNDVSHSISMIQPTHAL